MTTNTVLITGASRGLGREMALTFARAGWNIAVNGRSDSVELRATLAELAEAGAEALALPADIADRASHRALIDGVMGRWGRLDCLVNNAALMQGNPTWQLDDALWDRVLATNLLGPMHLARRAAEVMRPGALVANVISICGLWGCAGAAAYSTAKGALAGFTRGAAAEFAERGLRINAMAPGYMATDMGNAAPKARTVAMRHHAMGVLSDPRATAAFILALTRMPTVNGQVFNLDGRIRWM
jgi:3-oxoacyl-[acyl-carrier protein] reductase